MSNIPPYHWRVSVGYIPPATSEENASSRPPPNGGFYAPAPYGCPTAGGMMPPPLEYGVDGACFGGLAFPAGQPSPGYGGPLQAPGNLAFHPGLAPSQSPPPYTPFPVGFFPGPAGPMLGPQQNWLAYPPPRPPSPPATATSSSPSESGCDDEHPSFEPPGTKLKGGRRKGFGVLWTGKTCDIAVVDDSSISLDDLLSTSKPSDKLHFNVFKAQDNGTVTELIEALGGNEGSSLTQVWELGGGYWMKGTTMDHGSEKGKQKLAELGWTGAGVDKRNPMVILYFKKGEE